MTPWHSRRAIILQLVGVAIAVALLSVAIDWRSPLLASQRPFVLAVLISLPLALIASETWRLRAVSQSAVRRGLSIALLVTATASLIATLVLEVSFQRARSRVLAADSQQLETMGGHFVVGYRDVAEIGRLIDRRAIAGVFVGARNVEGLTAPAIRDRIEAWQEIRRRQGLPPLLIQAV